MRKTASIFLATAVALAAAAAAVAGARAPSLRLVQAAPLRVAGRGFHPLERVRVVLRSQDVTLARRVVAGRRGGFVVSFPESSNPDPCQGGLVIIAAGATGDHAAMKLVPRECPPATP